MGISAEQMPEVAGGAWGIALTLGKEAEGVLSVRLWEDCVDQRLHLSAGNAGLEQLAHLPHLIRSRIAGVSASV